MKPKLEPEKIKLSPSGAERLEADIRRKEGVRKDVMDGKLTIEEIEAKWGITVYRGEAKDTSQNDAKRVLYAIFSAEFDKWQKQYNPSNYFIEGGRTIPYCFNIFCSKVWAEMQHQKGTWFEMFREQMLNIATNWQNNLKDSLWETVKNFNINSA